MIVSTLAFESTSRALASIPWPNPAAIYAAVLIFEDYEYDQSQSIYADISQHVISIPTILKNKSVSVSDDGRRTILSGDAIEFTAIGDVNAIGLMIVSVLNSSSIESTDNLAFYLSFGEDVRFGAGDSVDISDGFYYFNNELV